MKPTTKKPVKFILVQSGYCVFGSGNTYQECLREASKWIEVDEQGDFTPQRIENELLKNQVNDGDFEILEDGDDEFDDYLETQGGFTKIDNKWFADY